MQNVPTAARWLGLSGLLPFLALAGTTVFMPGTWPDLIRQALIAYGAVILSFLGGCRWGFAAAGLGGGPGFVLLGLSVIPSLYAWVATLLAFQAATLILAAGFVGLYLADHALQRQGGAPAWWAALRLPLSAGATLSLAVAGLGA